MSQPVPPSSTHSIPEGTGDEALLSQIGELGWETPNVRRIFLLSLAFAPLAFILAVVGRSAGEQIRYMLFEVVLFLPYSIPVFLAGRIHWFHRAFSSLLETPHVMAKCSLLPGVTWPDGVVNLAVKSVRTQAECVFDCCCLIAGISAIGQLLWLGTDIAHFIASLVAFPFAWSLLRRAISGDVATMYLERRIDNQHRKLRDSGNPSKRKRTQLDELLTIVSLCLSFIAFLTLLGFFSVIVEYRHSFIPHSVLLLLPLGYRVLTIGRRGRLERLHRELVTLLDRDAPA